MGISMQSSCLDVSLRKRAGVGLSVWTLAVGGGGLSIGFWSLVACRATVGVGEASFVALASTFIGASLPPSSNLLGIV